MVFTLYCFHLKYNGFQKSYQDFHSLLEVCTGSKLKPEPGPYPRLSDPTRPDPSGTVKFRARTPTRNPPPTHTHTTNSQQKKRNKAAFHDWMQRNRLIKALPFHKHLPVMKVVNIRCSGRIHSAEFMNLYGQEDNSSTVQIMVIFCQLRLVSILSTLNQT